MGKNIIALYIGAKNRIASEIEKLLPYKGVSTYIEPFGGLYGVGLNKADHPIEIYNEINPKLVHLMEVLREHGDELLNRMFNTEYSMEYFKVAKEESEKLKNKVLPENIDEIQMAVYVWVTLLQSRNGMMKAWKGISKGNEAIVYEQSLIKKYSLHERVQNLEIHNRNALELIEEFKEREDVMMYCDSPYVMAVRTSDDLYEYEMKDTEQWQYAELIRDAKAKILVSGYKNEIYNKVLTEGHGWHAFPLIEVAKSSGNTKNGTKNREEEWVWMNYKPY